MYNNQYKHSVCISISDATDASDSDEQHAHASAGTFIIGYKHFSQLEITPYTPYIVFAISSWLAAALTYYTPETKDTKLPDTLDEAEHLEPETALSSRSELSTSQNIK